jgi:class 3 adenylate cyclase/tetratricopeptide (TPR) repeat protein
MKALAAAGRNSEALKHYQDLVAYVKTELMAEPDEETQLLVTELGRKRPSATSAGSGGTAKLVAPRSDPPPQAIQPDRAESVASMDHVRPDAPGDTRSRPEALRLDGSERRQVAVLVANLASSPSHSTSVDPEDMQALVSSFHRTVAEVVARFGGYVAPFPGDAVQVYFGYPTAHEHDALQAARAGNAIVEAVSGPAAGSRSALQARVSISTGLVVVGKNLGSEDTGARVAIGEAPAIAVQLQALAGPGEVVVSHDTRLLLGRMFNLRAINAVGLRGVPEQAWRVCGERDANRRREASEGEMPPVLVGRQEELDILLRRWDQAKLGEGRVVLISGEPGIGKSHIAESLLLRLKEDRPACLRYHCSAHQTIRPFHPYIAQLEWSARLSTASGPAQKLDRLEALISPTSTKVARDVALVAEILLLPTDERFPALTESPQQKREMALTLYLEMLQRLAAQRPVVMLFEDIHWIDPTSLDLLDRTIALIAHLPVLLIVTCRPEHQPAWVGQPHVAMLHLNRLGRRDSADIIGEVARARPLPQTVIDQIIEHTDGVPLFVKELSRHVLESAPLRDTPDGYVLDGPLRPIAIPTTLQASLTARLDRLGPARELALIGSAIGREFSYGLIAAVFDAGLSDLDAALDRLTASGLMSRRGTPPNASYVFTHALVRDAAYGMMLKDQRRRLHSKVATVLIDQFSAHTESPPEIVAHHLSEAGRISEAIDYWTKAGRSAQKQWANRECADFFGLALTALDDLPRTTAALRQAIDLRFELKNALTPMGEFDRIIEHLLEAEALTRQLDDSQRLCQFHVHMCQTLSLGGKPKEAMKFGQDARILAESLGNSRLLVEATLLLGQACFTITDYRQAELLFFNVLELLEAEPSGKPFAIPGSPEVIAPAYLAKVIAVRGDFDQGILYGEEAVRRAESVEQPYSLSVAFWCLADLHLTRGDIAPAVGLLERGLTLSRRRDLPSMAAAHSGSLGYAYALMERTGEGLPLLEQALGVFEKMNHQLGLSLFLVPLGDAYVLAGRLEQGRGLARRALKLAQESGHRSGEAGALRILAEAAALGGHLEQARQHYASALALAEKLEMRPLTARCHHGVGNVHLRMADLDKARVSLGVAGKMYREMAMWFWLEKVDSSILAFDQ